MQMKIINFIRKLLRIFCVFHPNYGKKIARMLFNKDLKCGNIFLNLEEEPNEKNKIVLDNTEKDSNGVPISNIYYNKSKKTLLAAKTILEELAELFINKKIGRVAIIDNIEKLENYENLQCTSSHGWNKNWI